MDAFWVTDDVCLRETESEENIRLEKFFNNELSIRRTLDIHSLPWGRDVCSKYKQVRDVLGPKRLNADAMYQAPALNYKLKTAADILDSAMKENPIFSVEDHDPLLRDAFYPYLGKLDLRMRGLYEIFNVSHMKILVYLNVSFNQISSLDPLRHLLCLEVLHAGYNKITHLSGLEKLCRLKDINLRNNYIRQLRGFDHCTLLRKLDVSSNQIHSHDSTFYLRRFKALENLNLLNNPVSNIGPNLTLVILPQVTIYNEKIVSFIDRTKARRKYKRKLKTAAVDSVYYPIKRLQAMVELDSPRHRSPVKAVKTKTPRTFLQMMGGDSFFWRQFEVEPDNVEILKLTGIPCDLGNAVRQVFEAYKNEYTSVTKELHWFGYLQFKLRENEKYEFLCGYVGRWRKMENQFKHVLNKWNETKVGLLTKIASLLYKIQEQIKQQENKQPFVYKDETVHLERFKERLMDTIGMLTAYKRHKYNWTGETVVGVTRGMSPTKLYKNNRISQPGHVGMSKSISPTKLSNNSNHYSQPGHESFDDATSYEWPLGGFHEDNSTLDMTDLKNELLSKLSREKFDTSELLHGYINYFRNKENFAWNSACDRKEPAFRYLDAIIDNLSSTNKMKKDHIDPLDPSIEITHIPKHSQNLSDPFFKGEVEKGKKEIVVCRPSIEQLPCKYPSQLDSKEPKSDNVSDVSERKFEAISKGNEMKKWEQLFDEVFDVIILDKGTADEKETVATLEKEQRRLVKKQMRLPKLNSLVTLKGNEEHDEVKKSTQNTKEWKGPKELEHDKKLMMKEAETNPGFVLFDSIEGYDKHNSYDYFDAVGVDDDNPCDDTTTLDGLNRTDDVGCLDPKDQEYLTGTCDGKRKHVEKLTEEELYFLSRYFRLKTRVVQRYAVKFKPYVEEAREFVVKEYNMFKNEEEYGMLLNDVFKHEALSQYDLEECEMMDEVDCVSLPESVYKQLRVDRIYIDEKYLNEYGGDILENEMDNEKSLMEEEMERTFEECKTKEEMERTFEECEMKFEECQTKEDMIKETESVPDTSHLHVPVDPPVSFECEVNTVAGEVTDFFIQIDRDLIFFHCQEYRLHMYMKKIFLIFRLVMSLLVFDFKIEVRKMFDELREHAVNFNEKLRELLTTSVRSGVTEIAFENHRGLYEILSSEARMDDALISSRMEATELLWETQDEIMDQVDAHLKEVIETADGARVQRHKDVFYKLLHVVDRFEDDLMVSLRKLVAEHGRLGSNPEFQPLDPSCPAI